MDKYNYNPRLNYELFLKEISVNEIDKPKLYIIYGSDNQQRTGLCSELCNDLENNKNIVWAMSDSGTTQKKDIGLLLLSLRNQFNKKYGLLFPSFDIIYLLYLQKNKKLEHQTENNYSHFTKGKSPVNNILKSAGEIPEKGFFPFLSNIFEKPGNPYNEWWKIRGKVEFSNILSNDEDELSKILHSFWIKDFKYALQNSNTHAYIFIHSYEPDVELGNNSDNHLTGDFLQKWINNINNTSFVITTRKKIEWNGQNLEWNNFVRYINTDNYGINNADVFFEKYGINDPELKSFFKKNFEESRDLLNLSLDLYNEIKTKKNRTPAVSDFTDFKNNIFESFISVLDKHEFELLKILSVTLNWNNKLLLALIGNFETGFPSENLDKLNRFSFIKESELPGTYSLDNNFREKIQHLLDNKEKNVIYKFLFEYFDNLISTADFKKITDADKKNFEDAFYYAKSILKKNDLANWFLAFNSRFKEAGLFRFMLPYFMELTEILNKYQYGNSKDYLNILINVGIYFKEIGKYKEAESFLKKAMKMLGKLYGDESEELAECMVNLADVLFYQGDFNEAEPLYLKAIVILNPLKSKESKFSVVSLINVAILFARQRKYDEAIPLFEKTLKIRIKSYGEEHPEVQKIYTNIANIEFDRKNYSKAETLYRKILNSKIKYFGDKHPEVSKAMINLGNVLIELNNFEEAESLYVKSKYIFEEFLGNEHPDFAMTLNNLAYLHFVTGKFEKSKDIYLQALNIYKNILGNEHPDLAILYNNIGKLYTKTNEFTEAEKYLKKSFEIKLKHFGFYNSETSDIFESLADLYEASGNYKEALLYLEKLEKILSSKLPPDNPEIMIIRNRLLNLKNKFIN